MVKKEENYKGFRIAVIPEDDDANNLYVFDIFMNETDCVESSTPEQVYNTIEKTIAEAKRVIDSPEFQKCFGNKIKLNNMSNFKVGCSPITSKIYAGTVLKNGTWAQNKHDVTDTAVGAVAQHLLQLNQKLEFVYEGQVYELKVDKKTKK